MAHDITATREFVEAKAREQAAALEAHASPSSHVSSEDRERWNNGSKGEKGDKGDKGDPGMPGPQGERGNDGEPGQQGLRGPCGEKGEKGDQGEKGDKGDPLTWNDLTEEQKALLKGEKGDKGDKGDPGERGADGADGRDGTDGRDGADGTVSFDELTPEQKALLKGEDGADGKSVYIESHEETDDPGSSSVVNLRDERTNELVTIRIRNGLDGEKGDPGEKGDKGDKGEKGDPGADGAVSFDELTPEQIDQLRGPAGDPGQTGAQGERGSRFFFGDAEFTGDEETVGELDGLDVSPAAVKVGDVYFNPGTALMVRCAYASGDTYEGETVGAPLWEYVGELAGPQGPKGEQGEKGEKGDKGDPDRLELYTPTAESSSTSTRDVFNIRDGVSNLLSVSAKRYLTLNLPDKSDSRGRAFVVSIDIGSSFTGSLYITWGRQGSSRIGLYQLGSQSLTTMAPAAGSTLVFFFEEYAENRFVVEYKAVALSTTV